MDFLISATPWLTALLGATLILIYRYKMKSLQASPETDAVVKQIISSIVAVADNYEASGPKKKEEVVQKIMFMLAVMNIKVDKHTLDAMIEDAVKILRETQRFNEYMNTQFKEITPDGS